MSRVIVDDETGTILGNLDEGDRILKKTSMQRLKRTDQSTTPKGETFTKLYHKMGPILAECNLSGAAMMVFLHLALNIRYDSNIAQYRSGWFITRKNLQSDLRLSEPTIQRAIIQLIKEGFVVEAKCTANHERAIDKIFVLNPYIVSVGSRVDKDTINLFRNSEHGKKWARW